MKSAVVLPAEALITAVIKCALALLFGVTQTKLVDNKEAGIQSAKRKRGKARNMSKISMSVAVSSFALGGALFAGNPISSAAAEEQAAPVLETVTVTAQKREENVQTVPLTVTAISGENLKKNSINSTQDLSFAVPSLNYNSIAALAQPFLRGIGSDITAPNADPSVATYVDGSYLTNPNSTITSFLGVDHVEVLEGPQGTLYGRNAIAGAINIYTLTPTDQFEATATAGFGDYARKEFNGHISGPITDNFYGGLYVAGVYRNSYIQNAFDTVPTGKEPTNDLSGGVRAKFVYNATSDFSLTGSVEVNGLHSHEAGFRQISPTALGYSFGAPEITQHYLLANDASDHTSVTNYAATLREDYNFQWARLVGISAYRQTRSRSDEDFDATAAPVLYFVGEVFTKDFSQELQLLSPDTSPIKWIAGLYFLSETGGYNDVGGESFLIYPPGEGAQLTTASYIDHSYAAFAEATAPLSFIDDNLSLTAGIRFSHEAKRYHGRNDVYDLFPGYLVGPLVSSTAYPNHQAQWDSLTPKFTLSYNWDGTVFYGTYSKGFASGAFNMTLPSDPGPVNPEKLRSIEVGTKSTLWSGRLFLNTAFYDYDFTDIQTQVTVNGAAILQNAASAHARGVEATINALVLDDLTLSGSLAYEDGHYGTFDSYSGPAGPVDVTGNAMQRMPKWVYTLGADFNKDVGNGSVHANFNWYWNAGFYWTPMQTSRQNSYNVANASVGYKFLDYNTDVSIWVSNLFDQYYAYVLQENPLGQVVNDAPPRMFGVRVTWSTN